MKPLTYKSAIQCTVALHNPTEIPTSGGLRDLLCQPPPSPSHQIINPLWPKMSQIDSPPSPKWWKSPPPPTTTEEKLTPSLTFLSSQTVSLGVEFCICLQKV